MNKKLYSYQNELIAPSSGIAIGNKLLRRKNYIEAITSYMRVLKETPSLGKWIGFNIVMAKQKYRLMRMSIERPSVAVCCWDLGHNAAGRAYVLAQLYESFGQVEIIGSHFGNFGSELWSPIRNSKYPVHSFFVQDEIKFVEEIVEFVILNPYDVVHLSKPRISNIVIGILYKLIWGSKIFVDIDDEELAFVNAEIPINIKDFFKKNTLPFTNISGKDWTSIAVGFAGEFDGITVSNPVLQKRYGGQIIRHARDEAQFQPTKELKKSSRQKLGIDLNKKVVLFFGTPRRHKGLLEVAQAIASLKRNDILFAIIGDFPDPKLKSKLQEIMGVDYLFLESQPFERIPEVVAAGDICVLFQDPNSQISHFQVPAKLTDALAMGLAVIVNDLPPLSDLIEDGAMVIANIHNLAEKIDNLVSDDNLRENLYQSSRALFSSKLTKRKNAELLQSFLSKTILSTVSVRDNYSDSIFHLLECIGLSYMLPLGDDYHGIVRSGIAVDNEKIGEKKLLNRGVGR